MVEANGLTDRLVIRITRIDGKDARESGYMRIAASKTRYETLLPWLNARQAWEEAVGGDYARVFHYRNGGVSITITGYREYLKYVFIPPTHAINNVPVTTISDWAFSGNELTCVTIGKNVKLEGGKYPSFPNRFDAYYNRNRKKAGTYTYTNGKWSGPK